MDEIKYKDRYRIPSARAWWHQYKGGTYFVTICTMDREHYFGEIEDDVMKLTEIGECLKKQIIITPQKRPDMNLEIPEFVIMPNHVHILVMIGDNVYNTPIGFEELGFDERGGQRRIQCVSTTENSFSPQSKNLASVIRGIKTTITSYALTRGIPFGWQSRFHDHIVRNVDELNTIANYIENNVFKWKEDVFYD